MQLLQKMDPLLISLLLYSLLGLKLCYDFQDRYKEWSNQTKMMKTALLVIAINMFFVVLCLLIVIATSFYDA